MSVVRVNKNKNYTTMSNFHLKEKEMSLKAKGLLSQMLSLPDNWDYSIAGLTKINKDGLDSIKVTLKELEAFGYLKRTRIKDEKGKYIDVEYTIYEKPIVENPQVEIPYVEKPYVEKPTQLNTKENKKLNNKKTKYIFKKPTLEEVEEYCKSRKNNVNAQKFYDFYEVNDWKDSKGEQVKNWKQKVITWEGSRKDKQEKTEEVPSWFNERVVDNETSEEEWNNMLNSFN